MTIPTLAEFRARVCVDDPKVVTTDVLLGEESLHVSETDRAYLESRIKEHFALDQGEDLDVIVVGSAKLGFSIVEKGGKYGFRPRYRSFSKESDIDLAVVSKSLYSRFWHDLSSYSHAQSPFPWSGDLAKYMLIGWARPDKFPSISPPYRCLQWWELFNDLSRESRFGRRRIRGALYCLREFLVQYQVRAIHECREVESR